MITFCLRSEYKNPIYILSYYYLSYYLIIISITSYLQHQNVNLFF